MPKILINIASLLLTFVVVLEWVLDKPQCLVIGLGVFLFDKFLSPTDGLCKGNEGVRMGILFYMA